MKTFSKSIDFIAKHYGMRNINSDVFVLGKNNVGVLVAPYHSNTHLINVIRFYG